MDFTSMLRANFEGGSGARQVSRKRSDHKSRHNRTNVDLACRYRLQRAAIDHAIDHSVRKCVFRLHDVIAVYIAGNTVDGLAGGVDKNFIQRLAHSENFAGVNIDIRRLSGEATHRGLMNQNPRMREAEPLSFGT